MNIIYTFGYYNTKVVLYVERQNLDGIERDFKNVLMIEGFLDMSGLLSLSEPLFFSSGIGIYYPQPYTVLNLNYTKYNDYWYCFYTNSFTEKPNNHAIITDENGYVTAVITQSEDWNEDYSFRTLFIDILLKDGGILTKISTLKSDENFEESLLCLDLRSFTERTVEGDYLKTKFIKFEEDYIKNYVRSLMKEEGFYYSLLNIKEDYLCVNFSPEQKSNLVNAIQKFCRG